PIDEQAWHEGHNLAHHPYTNVAGRDPDMHFGPVRLTERTPHRWFHRLQVPFTLFGSMPTFAFSMNLHFTGVLDVGRGGEGEPDAKPPFRQAAWRALRKFVPYYGKEFALFPLLAGPMFAKVMLGNALSELMRDLYTAASIHCGHIGEDVEAYAPGTRSGGRGGWYAMQVRSAHNFQVPYLLSVLCGGLDYQIEHHLFPKLPPERLRQIAPEVRAICEAHGVPYRTGPWLEVLGDALGELWRLSFPIEADAARHVATGVAT
ncbi:MAG: fatty acid desaturase, partial [Myxococcota bacterium]